MDKEQAKFILSSFSGSEADSKEEVFKEALELVVSDTELSEWFLKERKFDEAFMKAFESFTVPEDLREQVLAVLDPNIEIEQDELEIIGALATIQPPAGLREQILLGMEQTQPQEVKKGESNIIKMFFPLAAAAVVALGLYFGFGVNNTTSSDQNSLASQDPIVIDQNLLTAQDIPDIMVPAIHSGSFMPLDYEDNNYLKTVSWTEEHESPIPSALPEPLIGLPTMGCKTIEIKGHTGSLICFASEEHGPLHLIVVDAENGDESFNDLPSQELISQNCVECDMSGFSYAQWQADGKAYLLISPVKPVDEFSEIF